MVQRRPSKSERQRDEDKTAVAEKPARPGRVVATPSSSNLKEADDLTRILKAFGTKNPHFIEGLVQQVFGATATGSVHDAQRLLFTFAVARSTGPKDELEVMLLTQMATIHAALMKVAGELTRADTMMHYEIATRIMNQLARTYAAQMEGLKRYRSGVEPGVAVQTVSVSHGGQAIVTQGSAPAPKAAANSLLNDARQQPMDMPQRDLTSRPTNADPTSSLSASRRRPEADVARANNPRALNQVPKTPLLEDSGQRPMKTVVMPKSAEVVRRRSR